jgi:NADH-quinone oxidoreductase subunit J
MEKKLEFALFFVFAAISVVSACLMVIFRNPVYSALALILTFFSLAGLYILLSAQFVAAVHIMVYAGAIMVLFLFVIMLLNLSREEALRQRLTKWKLISIGLAVIFLAEVGYVLSTKSSDFESASQVGAQQAAPLANQIKQIGTVEEVGKTLFSEFLLPFEVTSVILLVALLGVVVLVKRKSEL